MKTELLEKFETGFSSSPVKVSDEEIEFIITHDCSCDSCGAEILELYDFPSISIPDDELLCEECEIREHYQVCPVCEDNFPKPVTPEETRFVVSKENSDVSGLAPGLYQAVSFPMFYGDCISGFDAFFEGSIKLVRPLDIASIQKERYGHNSGDVSCNEICPDCYNLLTQSKYIRNNYCDKTYGMHHIINVRGALQRGF